MTMTVEIERVNRHARTYMVDDRYRVNVVLNHRDWVAEVAVHDLKGNVSEYHDFSFTETESDAWGPARIAAWKWFVHAYTADTKVEAHYTQLQEERDELRDRIAKAEARLSEVEAGIDADHLNSKLPEGVAVILDGDTTQSGPERFIELVEAAFHGERSSILSIMSETNAVTGRPGRTLVSHIDPASRESVVTGTLPRNHVMAIFDLLANLNPRGARENHVIQVHGHQLPIRLKFEHEFESGIKVRIETRVSLSHWSIGVEPLRGD